MFLLSLLSYPLVDVVHGNGGRVRVLLPVTAELAGWEQEQDGRR